MISSLPILLLAVLSILTSPNMGAVTDATLATLQPVSQRPALVRVDEVPPLDPAHLAGQDKNGLPCISPHTGLDVCALQPGDILLAKLDFDLINEAISVAGWTYWFHVAIYLGDGELAHARNPVVAPASQVRVDSIDHTPWWTGYELVDWAVVRPLASAGVKTEAIAFARQKAEQTEPDVGFNINFLATEREDAFYCSQFVWRAYRRQGIDLATDSGSLGHLRGYFITPDEIYNSIAEDKALLAQIQASD